MIVSSALLLILSAPDLDGRSLVEEAAARVGTYERLKTLGDVEYRYTYRLPDGKEDVSIERYLFDGELSWARYVKREVFAGHGLAGEVIQGFDGKRVWVTADRQRVHDVQQLKRADFARKTNFYWFAMMQKLLDPGVVYNYEGHRNVAGQAYQAVKMTFKEGVGDVNDTYVLYINEKTKLIDQFLFTIMDFKETTPHLMRVEYGEFHGLLLPVTRRYTRSDWQGRDLGEGWVEEISREIRFGNGFDRALFAVPSPETSAALKVRQ